MSSGRRLRSPIGNQGLDETIWADLSSVSSHTEIGYGGDGQFYIGSAVSRPVSPSPHGPGSGAHAIAGWGPTPFLTGVSGLAIIRFTFPGAAAPTSPEAAETSTSHASELARTGGNDLMGLVALGSAAGFIGAGLLVASRPRRQS